MEQTGRSAMAVIDAESLTSALSEDAPCGPDLDLEGDPTFMNYMARAEGLLPANFFTRSDEGRLVPFDRTTIAFDKEAETILSLLETTRDLRLLVILAKFAILNRDLAAFSETVSAVGRLVGERWSDVHPRDDSGDFTLRMVTLQTLDDSPTVILPLQHAPLVPSRRLGSLTYRHILVAKGEATAREGEELADDATIEAAFRDVPFEQLVSTRDALKRLKVALDLIRSTWLDRAGYDEAIAFAKLSPLAEGMLAAVEAAVVQRDPAAASAAAAAEGATDAAVAEAGAAAPPVAAGPIRSMREAAEALAAAAGYYAANEPSSPALLLVRQAQSLMGKTFPEVIATLVPNDVEKAKIRFGVDQMFELPIARLSELVTNGHAPSLDLLDAQGADGDGAGLSNRPAAESRQQAVALLEGVGAFYRASEPASPIPLLTDRACGLSQKDFLTLLKDVLTTR